MAVDRVSQSMTATVQCYHSVKCMYEWQFFSKAKCCRYETTGATYRLLSVSETVSSVRASLERLWSSLSCTDPTGTEGGWLEEAPECRQTLPAIHCRPLEHLISHNTFKQYQAFHTAIVTAQNSHLHTVAFFWALIILIFTDQTAILTMNK